MAKSSKPKGGKKPKPPKTAPSNAAARLARTAVVPFAIAIAFLRSQRRPAVTPLPRHLARNVTVARARTVVPCTTTSICGARPCDRVVVDDWLPAAEVDALRSIAERGMAAAGADAAAGGPTIFDINSGFVVLPGARLENVHRGRGAGNPLFAPEDYALYRAVIRRLKAEVEAAFPRPSALYFTAPTFLTRLSGENASWAPAEAHDEYYHYHVDRESTPHYEFSGLLYLSDYGADFGGGLFAFEDGATVEPRRGRLSMFGSGGENRHQVRRVDRGQRITLSFWFACDERYEFKDFLDGKMHMQYGADAEL